MDLSIIAIPYLSKDDIVRFVDSIKQHLVSLTYEIILIDNSPNLETYNVVRAKYPEINIIHNTDNPGYARGMNQGFKLATGKYIAFMNPDMELVEDCFSPLIQQLESNPKIGLIAPQLQYGDRTIQPTVKNDPTLSSQLLIIFKLHHFIKTKSLKHYLAKDFDYSKPQAVEQLMGAFLMGKREVIEKIGGWDNDYPLWWEDLQFCTDTRKKGFLLYYFPQIKAIHYEGKSAAQEMSLFKQKRFNKGMRIYFKKNVGYFSFLIISLFSPFSLFLAWLSQKLHIKQRPQSKI